MILLIICELFCNWAEKIPRVCYARTCYICVCTVLHSILKVKYALVKLVYRVTEYAGYNLVLYCN